MLDIGGHKRKGHDKIKHGLLVNSDKTPSIYNIWRNMKARCNNRNNAVYPRYGGRGILLCEEWFEFKNFYNDMGDRPENMTLERVDNNKGYSKDNCVWATYLTQRHNQRFRKNCRLYPFQGQMLPLYEIGKYLNIKTYVLYTRIRRGWDCERAFSTLRQTLGGV